MTERVEYEKSALWVWMLAVLGVPFLLIGADLFFERKLIGGFGDLIYGAEELPAFEPRDTIIAVLFIIGGAALTLWGLKELVFPRKVFVADREGIRLAVAPPFRPAVLVPWAAVADIEYHVIDDEGDKRPVVRVEVSDRTSLPENPWGARWVSRTELLVDTTGWSPDPSDIVGSLLNIRRSGVRGTGEAESR